ncbi:MAG: UDP phosphate-alpha-4-amino-4-deoxy-L-arabinose arabinosyl transferase [Leptospiraceae bacterium]|nr:MAG: UDP phosphate-alpha-4-amino-4-deoxy-L-arabinose arabinosyl transferase [Leptospiraceae bacterium]
MYAYFVLLLLLIILVYFYNGFYPPPWPDEVLFSSPAISLANSGKFNTEVLSGIIYGMDKATLWNSPLYMFLLSFVYQFTGESLIAGRIFSLFIGILCIFVFYFLVKKLTDHYYLSFILTFILVIDLSFSRASNIIRMEILNLLFILLCIFFLEKKQRTLTGICTGLAGLTHPISIFLVPIIFIYNLNSLKSLIKIGFYALLIMLPWFIYIYQYWDVFQFQFIAQFSRKTTHYTIENLFYLIKVLGGQYQHKMNFILIYLFLIIPFILILYDFFHFRKTIKYFFIYIIILFITLLSSEGWYSIYPIPFALLYISIFLRAYPQYILKIVSFITIIFITIQFLFWKKTIPKINLYKKEYNMYIDFLNANLQDCKMIYIQSIPDPYFDLPKNKIYKEFPPYGLFKSSYFYEFSSIRINTYQQIDCFILSDTEPIEEGLQNILQQETYRKIPFPEFKILPSGYIYKK